MSSASRYAATLALLAALLAGAEANAQLTSSGTETAPITAGWVERVWLVDHGLSLDAKLDTGADTSSLDASSYETISRAGGLWARFTVKGSNGRSATIEAPIVRSARIRRAGTSVTSRPVVTLKICVGGKSGEAEFTLADRGRMDYPVLIGRAFMAGRIVVDPAERDLGDGKCAAPAPSR